MNFFSSLISHSNKIEPYLSIQEPINPKYAPQTLIKMLKSTSVQKELKKQIQKPTQNIFKVFKRLSILSLLLIYSDKFYVLLQQITLPSVQDKWVNEQFIQPYAKLLKKIAHSDEMYQNVKKQTPMVLSETTNIEMLFYNIGLFKLLFRIVNKMPLLGRYYKSKNEPICKMFINTIAVHAQKVYCSFRNILNFMIENAATQICNKDTESMMRVVLKEELPEINEEMKKLFLDKYFYPLGSGIGIKLFKPEEQTVQSQKTISGIINNHQDTNRQKQKQNLENTLFPEPGKVNMMFYEQTLLSHMRIGDDEDEGKFEEVVADIEAESDQEEHQTSIERKEQKNQNEIETGVETHHQEVDAK